jgi:hypothetical protein
MWIDEWNQQLLSSVLQPPFREVSLAALTLSVSWLSPGRTHQWLFIWWVFWFIDASGKLWSPLSDCSELQTLKCHWPDELVQLQLTQWHYVTIQGDERLAWPNFLLHLDASIDSYWEEHGSACLPHSGSYEVEDGLGPLFNYWGCSCRIRSGTKPAKNNMMIMMMTVSYYCVCA